MGSLAVKAHLAKNQVSNDSKKLNKIFALSGLNVKDGSQTLTTQLLKKKDYTWGSEYRYRIPLGRSFEDYVAKQKTIEAGINSRTVTIQLKDLRDLQLDRNIIQNIRSLYTKKLTHKKEIDLSYDGVLKVRVYNEPLTNQFKYDSSLVKLCREWQVPVGISRHGIVKYDFEKKAHIIVAGTTDFGKSNWVNCTINTLIMNKPENVSFTLIDLKGGLEFNRYRRLKQVKTYATSPEETKEALKCAVEKMDEVTNYLLKNEYSNVKEAGLKDRHFIIIDEAADIADDKECQRLLKDIARKGRAAGLRLIYTTQYPTTETISSQVKRNCIGRLCFVLDTGTASKVVLDQTGAENLPEIQGRALYKDLRLIELQTPLITPEIIKETVKPHCIEEENIIEPVINRERRENIAVFEETGLS